MKHPKLVIISDGKRVATVESGFRYGRGVKDATFEIKETSAPTLTLSIGTEEFFTGE